jgi:hypothetical protein
LIVMPESNSFPTDNISALNIAIRILFRDIISYINSEEIVRVTRLQLVKQIKKNNIHREINRYLF